MNRRFLHLLTALSISTFYTPLLSADTNSTAIILTEAEFADKLGSLLEKKVASNTKEMASLYKHLYYVPVWVGAKSPTKFAKMLFEHIEADESIKNIAELQNAYKKAKEAIDRAYKIDASINDKLNAELLTSKLYLAYLNYLLYGGIDWEAFDKKKAQLSKKYNAQVGWDRYKPPYNPEQLLVDAVVNGDFNSIFKDVEPKRFKYHQLKQYLLKYISIAKQGGWPKLPKYRRIKPNKNYKVIPLIRKHLQLTGDLQNCGEDIDINSTKYDSCLQKAIRRYKIRHGLKPNSIIDKETWRLLNEPVDSLITKMRLNLDRIKWLYHKEEPVRIELNIPAFRLYFYNGKELVNTMRVITGKPNHPTPSFHNTMKYVVVNPYWKIPQSIVKQEMLKHLIKDPYYYERRGKHLHLTWDENSPIIDPGSINWAQYRGSKPIPYYFMQDPGTSNALGKIKFLFPNKYSVYIHDTPTKKLFFKNIRAFSHGCMRIQKPREMLKTLSLFNDNIDVEELMALLKTKRKKTVVLKHKVPVDITYLTAFVDDYGNLNFRRDIYNYDKYQLAKYKYTLTPIKVIKTQAESEATILDSNSSSNSLDANSSLDTNISLDINSTQTTTKIADENITVDSNNSNLIDSNKTTPTTSESNISKKDATKKLMQAVNM